MLKLLLDEHISPQVARGLHRSNPRLVVLALTEWQGGSFLGRDDEACLREAFTQKLTFVTCDRRTIPPLLKSWAEAGLSHAGVIFVDEKTITPSDIGGLVRALAAVSKVSQNRDWTDRVLFLRR